MVTQTTQQAAGTSPKYLPAILGFAGALLGGLFAAGGRYIQARTQASSEDKRAIARAYLQYRVEALNELQRELHNCKRTYNRILQETNASQFTQSQYDEIQNAYEDFESAYDRVRIVFEDRDEESIKVESFLPKIRDLVCQTDQDQMDIEEFQRNLQKILCKENIGESYDILDLREEIREAACEERNEYGIREFYQSMERINEELREKRDQPVDRDAASSSESRNTIDFDDLNNRHDFDKKYEGARAEITSRLDEPLEEFSSGN